jgi:hypothetical protein
MKHGVYCMINKQIGDLNINHYQLNAHVSFCQERGKVILGIFYCQLNVHCKFISKGKTVNNEVYKLSFLALGMFRIKSYEKCRTKSCFLLQDNSPTHLSIVVKNFSVKSNVKIMVHLTWFKPIFTCSLDLN